MVRCKFFCLSKEVYQNGSGEGRVQLQAVYSNSKENEKFFLATPGGHLDFQTVNPEAMKQFERGKEYYIDITPAE